MNDQILMMKDMAGHLHDEGDGGLKKMIENSDDDGFPSYVGERVDQSDKFEG